MDFLLSRATYIKTFQFFFEKIRTPKLIIIAISPVRTDKVNHGVEQVGSVRLLFSPEPFRRLLYPLILIALNTLRRTITTNSTIPVKAPLTATVLVSVAGSSSTI